jgi:hypothetical protein
MQQAAPARGPGGQDGSGAPAEPGTLPDPASGLTRRGLFLS